MYRALLLSAPLFLTAAPAPTFAQASGAAPASTTSCQPAAKRRRGMLGSALGGIANRALSRAGVPSGVAGISLPIGSVLSAAIMSRLDCQEQEKAATATTEAVRGGVGTTANWTSETREGVSGSSTVLAQNVRADGASCMTVNDVIIVGGEETTVPKTMCRAPGASGYVLSA